MDLVEAAFDRRFSEIERHRDALAAVRSAGATLAIMRRHVTQRELRNDSGRIMRALDRGKSFTVTRNGVPVGELIPVRQRVFVPVETVVAAFAGAARLSRRRFRKDVDAIIDQDATPRGLGAS